MSRRGPWRLAGLALAVVLLVPASGCDGGDGKSPEAGPSASATVKSYEKSVAGVVEAATVFLETLDDDARAEAQLEFTEENAVAWSGLPCGSTCRPGVPFADLDAHQLAAAKSVLRTALGEEPGTGYERVEEILLADDRLAALQARGAGSSAGPSAGPSGSASGSPSGGPSGSAGSAGSGLYSLAFLGEPAVTGTWQLHFGGHHLAVHLTYENGEVTGASPFLAGAEPAAWTDDSRGRHEPLADMRKALLAMTGSLSVAEKAKAKLGTAYTEVLAGPGTDGQLPEVKEGLAAGSLTAAKKALVLAAIEPWVTGAGDDTAAALMAIYKSELDKTYIGWSGRPGLTAHGDYVRIDGPSVWVEFVCQNGVLVPDSIRHRTVYRDHTRDYGGAFPFS